MQGYEHYREAERLTELAESVDWQEGDPHRPNRAEYAQTVLAAAQVHATLAQAAAAIETAHALDAGVILRPTPADDADPAFPGTGWGRALFGDPQETP